METPIGAVSALEKRERAEMSGGGSIPPVSASTETSVNNSHSSVLDEERLPGHGHEVCSPQSINELEPATTSTEEDGTRFEW